MIKSHGKKPEVQCLSQLYMDITDTTANIDYTLTIIVQRRWGEEFTLVTNDGLELLDSLGTRGKN